MEEKRRAGKLPSQQKSGRSSGARRSGGGVGSILLLPFRLVWTLLSLVLGIGGRLVTIVLGLALIVVGIVLTVLTLGTLGVCGVPISIFGGLMVLRGLFK